MPKQSKSKTIAKNAVALYFRMAVAMIVSLYSSRIVLQQLGVDGYGTYTLVAGIVTFWLFINGSMTVASTRFLAIAIESKQDGIIRRTFSSVFFVHLLIALILIILGETVGLWFFTTQLKIIPEFRWASKIIYQLSIVSVAIGILQVPYTAYCVADEKMGIFARFEVVNSLLKLLSAIALIYLDGPKIIIYPVLLLLNTVVIFTGYFAYTRRKFGERIRVGKCHFSEVKQICSFTSWDLYSNGTISLRMQGTAVLYNIFINTIANAALGISLQVQGVVTSFASSIATAVRPQITKSFANGSIQYLEDLVCSSSKLMGGLILLPLVPLVIETPFVLSIWLGKYPQYTVWFCRLSLISVYYWTFSTLLHSIIHATGKVKMYSFISGTIIMSEVGFIYLIFKFIAYPYVPQLIRITVLICLGGVLLWFIKRYIPSFNSKKYFRGIYVGGSILLCAILAVSFLPTLLMEQGWIRFITISFISVTTTILLVWFFSFNDLERGMAKKHLKGLHSKLKMLFH